MMTRTHLVNEEIYSSSFIIHTRFLVYFWMRVSLIQAGPDHTQSVRMRLDLRARTNPSIFYTILKFVRVG